MIRVEKSFITKYLEEKRDSENNSANSKCHERFYKTH